MCGIAGILNAGNSQTLQEMNNILAHRGPDGEGIQWFPETNVGLAHRRLAILDPSPAGHQPMCSNDGRYWIVHSGEVYNYKTLQHELYTKGYRFQSQSDTEVILKSFQAWNEDCLHRFNGMFAFAIYDQEADELFLARDRIGAKPLYYASLPQGLVFASEIKAILSSGLIERTPDYFALHTPTRFQIPPFTGFKNIFKLPPGHYLRYRHGRFDLVQYWSIKPVETFSGSEQDASELLEDLLLDSVRLQLVSDVPVGILLSGGLDSSLVGGLARQFSDQVIHSFTCGFSAHDQKFEQMPADAPYAREIARIFNFEHHERELESNVTELLPKMIWHLDEPLADPAAINLFLLCTMARDHGIIVGLTGMGGDEIFGGYRKYLACLRAEPYREFVPGVIRMMVETAASIIPVATHNRGLRTLRWMRRFIPIASLPGLQRYLSSDLSLSPAQYGSLMLDGVPYEETHFYREHLKAFEGNGVSYLTKMCVNDSQFFLPEHNLNYSDKAAMAAGVEARQPLTDHRIVEFMFTLPPHYRIRGRTQKYLLKEVAKSFVPQSIIQRPKAPFASPLRSWIRGPLAAMVDDLLSDATLKKRGLYDPACVGMLIERDRSGSEDNALVIWMLLTNEIWFRTFFE